MKKLLLIAVIALGVVSCNKDKKEDTPTICGAVTEINYDSGGYYVILDYNHKHYVPNGNYQIGQTVCTD